jgi:hypothetical protein
MVVELPQVYVDELALHLGLHYDSSCSTGGMFQYPGSLGNGFVGNVCDLHERGIGSCCF